MVFTCRFIVSCSRASFLAPGTEARGVATGRKREGRGKRKRENVYRERPGELLWEERERRGKRKKECTERFFFFHGFMIKEEGAKRVYRTRDAAQSLSICQPCPRFFI